jgi:flavin-dependent dehydrogenase
VSAAEATDVLVLGAGVSGLACAARGQPVVISQPRSQFGDSIRAMARQIAGLPSVSSESWWQRFRRGGRPPASRVA